MAEAVLDRPWSLAHALIGNGLSNGELVMTLICLIGGGAGLFFWRKVNAALTSAK